MNSFTKFEIVQLDEFAENGAVIYSIALNDDDETLFDRFLEENKDIFPNEIDSITSRLRAINKLGARPNFFKDKEGKFGTGDGIEALYDEPDSNLRLYCIRYGTVAIILGGGGYKPKSIRAFQDDVKLTEENYLLRRLSVQINQAIKEGDIYWHGNFLVGKLRFDQED